MSIELRVQDDGVTHINVFTRGATELGRLLTNPAYSPFRHPLYGEFDSVEGLWFWLKTGRCNDFLRTLSGVQARTVGKGLQEVFCKSFKEDVTLGIKQKIAQNTRIIDLITKSDLPFTHYYWFGDKNNPVIRMPKPGNEWVIDVIEEVRTQLKEVIYVPLPLVHIGQQIS